MRRQRMPLRAIAIRRGISRGDAETRRREVAVSLRASASPRETVLRFSSLSSRNHQLLQRLAILLRREADRRAGGASADAGGAAADAAAEIALHGHGLLDLGLRLGEKRLDPAEDRALRLLVHHE